MRTQRVVLAPLNEIEAGTIQGGFQSWEILGGDPQFQILGVSYPLAPGLYRLTIQVADDSEAFEEPMIFLDSGSGFSQQAMCWLNFTGLGSTREALFLVRQSASGLRFDPRITPGTLRFGAVKLVVSA